MRNTKYNAILSSRLKALLTQYSLSISATANFLEISKSMILRFLRGENMPSSEVLSNLADFFCVSTDYLLGRTDDPQTDFYFNRAKIEFFDDPEIPTWAKEQYQADISIHPQFAPIYLRSCRRLVAEVEKDREDEKKTT